jgi:hypothetical protein
MRPPKKKPTAIKLRNWRVAIMRARAHNLWRQTRRRPKLKPFSLTEARRKRLPSCTPWQFIRGACSKSLDGSVAIRAKVPPGASLCCDMASTRNLFPLSVGRRVCDPQSRAAVEARSLEPACREARFRVHR